MKEYMDGLRQTKSYVEEMKVCQERYNLIMNRIQEILFLEIIERNKKLFTYEIY